MFAEIVKEGCGHHPHGLTDPTAVADFIVAHCAGGDAAQGGGAGRSAVRRAHHPSARTLVGAHGRCSAVAPPNMKTAAIIACTAAATAALTTPAFAGKQGRVDLQALVNPVYTVEGDAFVRHNGDRYSNRPLYCNHLYAVVLAGDKPYSTLGHETNIFGNLMFALVRDGQGKWLQHASDITSRYRPGRMEWTVKDEAWGETVVHLEVVPAAVGAGLAARVRVEGTKPGDTLVWASGGATIEKQSVLWEDDVMSLPGNIRSPLVSRGFVPADCERNEVAVTGYSWTLQAVGSLPVATGRCSVRARMCVADAEAWKDPAALVTTQGYARPIACGTLAPRDNEDVYWSLLAPDAGVGKGPAEEFAAGMQREEAIAGARRRGHARPVAERRGRRLLERRGRLFPRRHLHAFGDALEQGAAGLADALRRHRVRLARERQDPGRLLHRQTDQGVGPRFPEGGRAARPVARGAGFAAVRQRAGGRVQSAALRHAEPVF